MFAPRRNIYTHRRPLICLLGVLCLLQYPSRAQAAPGAVTTDATGVTLETTTGLTRVEIWGDRIARVLHTPATTLPNIASLAVIGNAATVSWQFQNNGSHLLLTAPDFTVRVESPSGQVSFLDAGSATILAETATGTTLTATTVGNPGVPSHVVTQKFDLGTGEAIYGLGQHQAGIMNYVGTRVTLLQENTKVAVPVWLSNKGYCVLWDNPAVTTVDVGQTTAGKMSWSSEAGDAVNYYFCYGPEPDAAIAGYRALTGAAPMFGKWAWGYWQSKERYQTQAELLSVAAEYRSRNIPIDGIIQDWRYWPDLNHSNAQYGWGSHAFDPARYPNPAALMSSLHSQNIHTLISVWAKYEVTNSGVSIANLQGLEAVGAAFNPAIPFVYPAGQGKWYDPFNAAGRQVFWNQVSQQIFSHGWDGWWLDASEAELSGNWGEFRNFNTALGPGAKHFNAYPLMHTKAAYEGQRAETSQKRAIILTRSAYAGQQRHASITWSGDIQGNWSVFANQIPAGLNFTATGIPYWNTDIGGFFSGNPATASYAELFTRWFQYGAFCPMFRVHGTSYAKEVWRFPSATQPILIDFIKLRYRLMPYIYSTAWKVTNEGYTMMRPLVMDFRHDPNVNGIGNQFMFGPAFLVNPVTTAGATSRSVYLPAGVDWYDFWSGLKISGGQTIQASAPIEKMPLFVKAGSIIPWGPSIQYATESSDPIELRVYPGANGSFTLYEDEGDNYNYESGTHATIPFTWDETAQQLTIGQRVGSFPGMLASRTFRVVFVAPVHGAGLETTATADSVVSYSGNAVVVTRPPPPALPAAPSNVNAVAGSSGITISWNGPVEGTVYRVQRALQSGGPYTTVAGQVIGTNWLDTGVNGGSAYYYVVSAANAAGEGPASAEVSAISGTPSLLTLLMFNEASGTNAADGSGRGMHSTLFNGPARVTGKGGNAVDLSGSSQYISLPAAPVNTLNNFTIAAWVNLDAVSQYARIFDFGSGTNSYMFLTPRSADNTVRFAITTSGLSGEQRINGTAPLPTGAWTHIAVTLSGSTGILYVNGVAVGSNPNMTLSPQSLGATTQNWIGRSQFSADPYLDGRVDDFRIYSGAFSAADIQALAGGSASALLSPWTGQDIGSPGIPGSSGCGVSGIDSLHLTASGADIWGTADQFRFVWQTRGGNTEFIARVDAMDASDPWAKAGLMVRSGTGAGAVNCLIAVTPQNGVTFQYRNASGGSTSSSQASGITAPRWLKITRAGNVFTAFHSADGVMWSQVGSSITLSAMPATAYYGIALTAHTNSVPVGAAFSRISILDPFPPIPLTASLTAPTTDLDDRYFLSTGFNDSDNIGGSGISSSGQNDEETYVAVNRSSKGQTFTTGYNPSGYTIGAFTFQHVLWPQYLNNGTFYDIQPGDTFEFQIGVMSGVTKTPIKEGLAIFSGTAITGSGTSGTGKYLTFDLSSAGIAKLSANTTYYFEIAPASGDPYLELNGSRVAVSSGATAFRGADAGTIGAGVNTLSGERIFHVNLTKVAGQSYSTWIASYPGLGSETNAADDPDGDGMTNGEEYSAGTDPSLRTSVLGISLMTPNGDDMIISFPSAAGKLYHVERSDTLQTGSWTAVQQNIEGTGEIIAVTDPNGAAQPKRFYRIVVFQ